MERETDFVFKSEVLLLKNNTKCPIKCFNMDCENRDYSTCYFFLKEYSRKTNYVLKDEDLIFGRANYDKLSRM